MKLTSVLASIFLFGSLVPALGQHGEVDPRPPLEELDLSIVLHGMASRDFKERQASTERLLEISRVRFPQVAKALFKQAKKSRDPEVRVRSEGAFKGLFEFHVLGKGDSNLGVQWHWHVQQAHTGEMRARPLVRKIDPKSAAAKAGLKVGDIVCYIDGKEVHRQKGVLQMREIFRNTKPDQELTLTVRNVKLQENRYTSNPAVNRKVKLKVARSDQAVSKAKAGEFDKWLAALKAEHDVD